MGSNTQISCVSVDYWRSVVSICVYSAINTISNSSNATSYCDIEVFTITYCGHSLHCCTKHCCIQAVLDMQTVDKLIDINVAILAILNSDIDTFNQISFVFHCHTFVQECNVL